MLKAAVLPVAKLAAFRRPATQGMTERRYSATAATPTRHGGFAPPHYADARFSVVFTHLGRNAAALSADMPDRLAEGVSLFTRRKTLRIGKDWRKKARRRPVILGCGLENDGESRLAKDAALATWWTPAKFPSSKRAGCGFRLWRA
jgi:hypothetical protein